MYVVCMQYAVFIFCFMQTQRQAMQKNKDYMKLLINLRLRNYTMCIYPISILHYVTMNNVMYKMSDPLRNKKTTFAAFFSSASDQHATLANNLHHPEYINYSSIVLVHKANAMKAKQYFSIYHSILDDGDNTI